MGEFIRFNSKHRVSYQFSMINSSSVSAIAVSYIKNMIVDKSLESLVDGISNSYFLGMFVYNK